MNFISLTPENLSTNHICCAIDNKKSATGVAAKKEWLACRMKEGLQFKKLDARGKVFIEYLPAAHAWVPIEADGYLYINCHWVSGSFKNQGYGKVLLAACEVDARKTNGVVLTVGSKKKPFLSEKSFFLKQGFEVCDKAEPYFELLVKRFNPDAALPQFKNCAKEGMPEGIKGMDIFYTTQCPFTLPYIELISEVVRESEMPIRVHQINTKEAAQNHFCPVTTYSIFIDGLYVTNEIQTAEKLLKLIKQSGY